MNGSFCIALNGLRAGKKAFSIHAGKEFFANFDNSEILDADVSVEGYVEKSGGYTGIDFVIEGTVTVPCDRCLEPVTLDVSRDVRLSVKWGDEPAQEPSGADPSGREVVYLPADAAEFDLSQTVYDYVILSMPLQKVHPDGECNPDAVRFIKGDAEDFENRMPEESPAEDGGDNPFAALKDLLEKGNLN